MSATDLRGQPSRQTLPLGVLGQLKIGESDPTYRRVLAGCCPFSAPSIDLQAHAAQITLNVHRARSANQ